MMMLSAVNLLLWIGLAFHTSVLAETRCSVDGKHFSVGEQNSKLGQCNADVCMDDGKWAQVSCSLAGIPDKWVLVPENLTKPYPECCSHAAPPLDIVPDVLDKLERSDSLDITYAGGHKVDFGNELTPTQVKSEPTVTYQGDPDSYYLLCMIGPDAPSRQNPSSREFQHWLVGNIPGSDVAKGEVLSEYVGSGPPQGTGLHRYVFLLYKQPGKLTLDEPRVSNTSAEGRARFSIQKFAEKYNLGEPVAINVYQALYDDYVPEVHKQLGFKKN